MNLIDGKKIAQQIRDQVRKEVQELNHRPGLAVFLIGDDEASKLYVKLKEKASKEVGIDFHKYVIEKDASEEEIKQAVEFINQDPHVDAILIQIPVPDSFNQQAIINTMDPKKDVDGFHPETLKAFLAGKTDFVPGLTNGIVRLIESTKQELKGKKSVILSNSEIFADPLEKVLKEKGIEVESISSPFPEGYEEKTREADILIVALGKPEFVKADMIKQGAILIDVGTTKLDDSVLGDVDAEDVKDKAGWLTPVPGGVGPVTVAMLLENTVKLAKRKDK